MWFNPDQIVSVKAIGKDKCILWTSGQPATDMKAKADALQDAFHKSGLASAPSSAPSGAQSSVKPYSHVYDESKGEIVAV